MLQGVPHNGDRHLHEEEALDKAVNSDPFERAAIRQRADCLVIGWSRDGTWDGLACHLKDTQTLAHISMPMDAECSLHDEGVRSTRLA